jgi:hypothetical protein
VNAATCAGTIVPYTVTATDACAFQSLVCTNQATGFAASSIASPLFSIGPTVITCTATDMAGLTTTGSFTTTVSDQAPTIICPVVPTITCVNGAGAASFTVTATDPQEGNITSLVTCSAASGSSFPLGSTPVSCSVTDCSGLTDQCTFTVTVEDITPPTIVCPNPATTSCPMAQTFVATATSVCFPADTLTVSCSPASQPAIFANVTAGQCSAGDLAGLESTCLFTYFVVDTTPPTLSVPPSYVFLFLFVVMLLVLFWCD